MMMMMMTRRNIVVLVIVLTITIPVFVCQGFVVVPSLARATNRLVRHSSSPTTTTSLFQSSSSSSSQQQKLPYDWKEQWYALTYANHVPNPSASAETVPASVFGHPLVLWRSHDDDGIVHCADDACPHRRAALSEGRVRDGKLECYYHGWQFQGSSSTTATTTTTDETTTTTTAPSGACTFIPQLATGATIPKAACLRMRECRIVEGIVWVWMGDDDDAGMPPTKDVPKQGDGLDPLTGERPGFIVNDFQIDLPYDHSYLVENLIDPAHIPISHDRTPGGGRREKAEAYEMIVDEDSIRPEGFTGRYRLESQQRKGDPFIEVRYEAPGIIRQRGFPRGLNSTIQFGAALHCMPLSLGRSRLLFRAYFGGLPPLLALMFRFKPAFLRNLNSCKILEQDVGLITTQEDYFQRQQQQQPPRSPKDDFLLLQSSDVFVKTYRQWLDQVGHGMPWFQGLATGSANINDHLSGFVGPPALNPLFHRAGNVLETRYHRHVMHCPATRNALARIRKLKKIMLGMSVTTITLSLSLLYGGLAAIPTSTTSTTKQLLFGMVKQCWAARLVPIIMIPVSCGAAAFLHKLEQRFFVSFRR